MLRSSTGLQEIEKQCKQLDIEFHFLIGCGKDVLPSFVEEHKFGAVVIDFCPLRGPRSWAEELKTTLPKGVPLIQVRKLSNLLAINHSILTDGFFIPGRWPQCCSSLGCF